MHVLDKSSAANIAQTEVDSDRCGRSLLARRMDLTEIMLVKKRNGNVQPLSV